MTVKERFLHYILFDTRSDDKSDARPSTPGQVVFANALKEELISIGLTNVSIDKNSGIVYASLAANSPSKRIVGFIAHLDTSPDARGDGVTARVIPSYGGGDIQLSNGIALSTDRFPELERYIGCELIVTSGETLLGADDKAGIAEIVTAMEYFVNHPEIAHGEIRIAFTPDEEIGKGSEGFDIDGFGAEFAYTIDGGALGELSFECFNASKAVITFHGRSVHPGEAKGVMVNSAIQAADFVGRIPANERPETTDEREGFFHVANISGTVESTRLEILIRDFDAEGMRRRESLLTEMAREMNAEILISGQYQNMAEIISEKPVCIDIAKRAFAASGVTPNIKPIRGGTDGANLSFNGLPCPNIFTGGHNFHGPYEYVPVASMEKAVDIIIKIAELANV